MRRYRIGDRVRWVGDIERVDDRHHEVGTVVGIEYDLPPDGSGRTLDPATASDGDPDWQYVGYRVRFGNGEEESYVDGQIEPVGEPLRVTGVQERAQVVRVEETGEQAVGLVVQLADGTHRVLVFSNEVAGAIREALSGDPA